MSPSYNKTGREDSQHLYKSMIVGHLISRRIRACWEWLWRSGFVVSPRSIPAVLCSNNWQSAAPNEPSTGNHAAAEPVDSNHITAAPVVVHQLAEFDQDSWTLDARPGDRPESSADRQTNKNHNNNNGFSSEAAFDEAKAPKSDPISNHQSGANGEASSPPSEPSEASKAAVGDATAAGSSTSNGDSAEPQTTSRATDSVNGQEDQGATSTESPAVDL